MSIRPGGPSKADLSGTYQLSNRTKVLALLGTSITNQAFVVTGNTTGTASKGYPAWANVILGHRFTLLNHGVSGNNSAQMLARVPNVIAAAPGYCVVEAGIPNDIGAALTIAQTIANHSAIYDQLAAAGIDVTVCTALPYGLSDTTANRQTVAKFNLWARAYARTKGYRLCDWAAMLTAQDGTGLFYPNFSDGVTSGQNGIHPTPPAAKVMGKALAATLNETRALPGLWLPSSNGDPFALFPNPMMLGTGGTTKPSGVTGNLATSWACYNNGGTSAGLLSKVARTDDVQGEWQQLQMTAGNADGIKIQGDNTAVGTAFAVGDLLVIAAEFQTDNDWVGGLDLNMTMTFGGSSLGYTDLQRAGSEPGIGQPPASGVLLVSGVVPAGGNRLKPEVYGRATTGTFRVGRFHGVNLTQMAAAGVNVTP